MSESANAYGGYEVHLVAVMPDGEGGQFCEIMQAGDVLDDCRQAVAKAKGGES